eukprot:CAMPEP_0167781704 /NCGR_PEP_ID=MMETSP0111_2-20121227/6082_1 /TAXON_ID=91324 /ORGANISM="Lotharella globosa, Strain CCCM811" /LENGTH=390 /DNA_ID=CAMNT_0007672399 /DNA_START=37 /DNA_END=1209 /DNA_ORIENTATION=+
MFRSRGKKEQFRVDLYVKQCQIAATLADGKAPTFCRIVRSGKCFQTSLRVPKSGQTIWNETVTFKATMFMKNGSYEPKIFKVQIVQKSRILYSTEIDLAQYVTARERTPLELQLIDKNKEKKGNLLLTKIRMAHVQKRSKMDTTSSQGSLASSTSTPDLPSFGKKIDMRMEHLCEAEASEKEEGKKTDHPPNDVIKEQGEDEEEEEKEKEEEEEKEKEKEEEEEIEETGEGPDSPYHPEPKEEILQSQISSTRVMNHEEDLFETMMNMDETNTISGEDSPEEQKRRIQQQQKMIEKLPEEKEESQALKYRRRISGTLNSIFEDQFNQQAGINNDPTDDNGILQPPNADVIEMLGKLQPASHQKRRISGCVIEQVKARDRSSTKDFHDLFK